MKNLKKITLMFIIGIGLFVATSINFATAANAQVKSNLSTFNFLKQPDWDKYGIVDLKANNLDKTNNEVTAQTTKISVFTTNHDPSIVQTVVLYDTYNNEQVMIIPFIDVANFELDSHHLIKGHEYQVQFSDFYSDVPIASFMVSSNDWSGDTPPIINANSRKVKKDDPNFNIMGNVSAFDEYGNNITNKININGKVDIHNIGNYPVKYSVTDQNGLSSSKDIIISVVDSPNPPSISKPILDRVTDKDTVITGKGTPNNYIYVILGTNSDIYREKIGEDGRFKIKLDHTYPARTSIDSYTEDNQGNKSEHYYGIVEAGDFSLGVNQILSSDTSVSGYTIPGAEVTVAVQNTRDHLFIGRADNTGKYVVDMHGISYPAGTSVCVTANLNGHSASKTVIIYPKRVSIESVKVGDQIIKGEADPNSIVYLTVNSKEYEFKVDAAGNFKGDIKPSLLNGDRISAYQISNNIQSDTITIDVTSR